MGPAWVSRPCMASSNRVEGISSCIPNRGKGRLSKSTCPSIEEIEEPVDLEADQTPAARGTETILLVEDEDLVRDLAKAVLVQSGYTVLEACDGNQALEGGPEVRWRVPAYGH